MSIRPSLRKSGLTVYPDAISGNDDIIAECYGAKVHIVDGQFVFNNLDDLSGFHVAAKSVGPSVLAPQSDA